MMKALQHILLASMLACTSLAATAQGEDAAAAVAAGLQQGSSFSDIIRSLVGEPHDLTLAEATVAAMNAGGAANSVDFVNAGVALAGNLPQAQEVVNAVRAAAGETAPEALAATAALQAYVRVMPQPEVYEDNYSATGGAVLQGGATGGGVSTAF
ncbi:hypothetical protein [Haliea sp. E17]|uniref:hypothetical protein n=1 Tax=Haliea sp. E17 TaxID=3401576 RepID=UPI003AAAA32F